jgi:Bardet-Biedl syndrome 5 protein
MAFASDTDYVWQDREIRFDAPPALLDCRKGEIVIDSINSVEDTKGNNGARGSLIVTNLRIIWLAHSNANTNISVGLNTVISVNIRKAKSKLRGTTQALVLLSKSTQRFEFIFTSLVMNSPRLFTTVQAIMKAYETSKLYRELKLRGSVIKDGTLMLLPLEQLYSRYNGVMNLSSDQGNLGTFYFTNVRMVWHADLANNFNVSCPYMQIKSIVVRNSKFGKALVVETFARAGGYILGFRLHPDSLLKDVEKELASLFSVYSVSPVFGIEFSSEEVTPNLDRMLPPRIEEDSEILEGIEDTHAVAAYYVEDAQGNAEADDLALRNVTLDANLGLAVEGMPHDVTTEALWRVM